MRFCICCKTPRILEKFEYNDNNYCSLKCFIDYNKKEISELFNDNEKEDLQNDLNDTVSLNETLVEKNGNLKHHVEKIYSKLNDLMELINV